MKRYIVTVRAPKDRPAHLKLDDGLELTIVMPESADVKQFLSEGDALIYICEDAAERPRMKLFARIANFLNSDYMTITPLR